MKYLIISLLLFTSISGFAQQTTVLPESVQHEDNGYQKARAEWIHSMHRAEPGLNWKVIDEATRQAKSEAYYSNRKLGEISIQSVTQDTFANGKVVGTWSERGSNNICGRTHTADIDFETNTLYVASSMGNIWKTELGKSEWTVLNDASRFGDIRMLRILPTANGKRLVAASNGPTMVRYSNDDGKTWKQASGLDGPKSWGGIKRAVVAADGKTMYIVGNEWDYSQAWRAVAFLYRSTDQGAHFTKIGNWDISTDLCDIWVSRDTTSTAYFIKGDSLYTITAQGQLAYLSMKSTTASQLLLDGKVENGITTLAKCEVGPSSEIFTSTGLMNDWTSIATIDATPFGANSFRISHTLPMQMYFGTNDFHVWTEASGTFDVPSSWDQYYADPETKLHADIDGIDIFSDPTGKEITLVSTDGGTYISTDRTENVENLTLSGIRTSQYYSTYTSVPPYVINAGSQDQGFQRGADNGSGILDMDQIISGDYGHLTSSDGGKSLWGDYPGFALYYPDARTSNNAQSWNFVGNNKLWIPPMLAAPGKANKLYIACGDSTSSASRLWLVTDSASKTNGSMFSYDFSLGNKDRNISAIALSPFDSKEFYMLSNDGYFFRSIDGGLHWTHSDTNRAPGSHYFYGSTILPSRLTKGKLWVAGSGYSNPGVFVSNDNGATFIAIDSGLPKTLVYGMASSANEKFLFAATEVGPYIYSVEAGQWFDLQTTTGVTAPDMVYWCVENVPQSNFIRFGTYGRGIWDFAFDTVKKVTGSVSATTSTTPISIKAIPSIARTSVRFEVTTSESASISIYDIEGRRVKLLPSTENMVWDVSSIPTGFYTAILRTKGSVAATKVEVIR
jgi:hypothetical protein